MKYRYYYIVFIGLLIAALAGCIKYPPDKAATTTTNNNNNSGPGDGEHGSGGGTDTTPPPPPPPVISNIKIFGHKGGGNNSFSQLFIEQTMASIQEGVTNLDGIEVDLQMSLDGTIWMYEGNNVKSLSCNGDTLVKTIPTMHDADISAITMCYSGRTDRLYKLSELMPMWENSANGFYLSMEIVMTYSTSVWNAAGGKTFYLKKLADKLALLVNEPAHPGKVFCEVDNVPFRDELKLNPRTAHILNFLNENEVVDNVITNGVKEGYQGIMLKYSDAQVTAAKVDEAHSKGLKVQLVFPNDQTQLQTAFDKTPDFIQTDNMDAKVLLGLH